MLTYCICLWHGIIAVTICAIAFIDAIEKIAIAKYNYKYEKLKEDLKDDTTRE